MSERGQSEIGLVYGVCWRYIGRAEVVGAVVGSVVLIVSSGVVGFGHNLNTRTTI